MPRVTVMRNPAKRKGTWSAFCRNNGCTFMREGLTKAAAEREATSHGNAYQHDVGIVDMATPRTNPRELVEKYRGVSIRYEGGYYYPDIVAADGGNVSIPRLSTLTAARRFVGLALNRGAIARDQWRPAVTNPARSRRVKANPAATRVAQVLSTRAVELRYLHAEDKGQAYKHPFTRGVTVQLLTDGSVRLYRPDGRPLWKNFR